MVQEEDLIGPAAVAADSVEAETLALADLVTDRFVARHSAYKTLAALLHVGEAAGVEPDAPGWDGFISRATEFPTWDALLEAAGGEWLSLRLAGGAGH